MRLPAHQPEIDRRVEHGDDEYNVPDVLTGHRYRRHGQDEHWEGLNDIRYATDRFSRQTSIEARDDAHRNADRDRERCAVDPQSCAADPGRGIEWTHAPVPAREGVA